MRRTTPRAHVRRDTRPEALEPLFNVDLKVQGTKFMEKLALAVKGLDDLDSITPFVQSLGRRHAGNGVTAKRLRYDPGRAALRSPRRSR